MRIKRFFLSFILLILVVSFWPQKGNTALSGASESVTLSGAKWMAVQSRFEKEIAALIAWFQTYENRKKDLTLEISDLQDKTAHLRDETRDQSNLFKEIRLKELLNKLRDKLEENSNLDHEADLKRKEFEEKSLSLIDLYNSRIEFELESGETNVTPDQLKSKVDLLSELARQRNRVQVVLDQYGQREDKEKWGSVGEVFSAKTNDKETLQLTLDLFKDRQKNLQEQMEKWSLELDSLRNQLKLQGEMKDFLKDIQNMNADSNFPQGNLKQEDLEFLSGDSQKKKLLVRLDEVQKKISRGQKLLAQIEQLSVEVRGRLEPLNEDKKP
jgi:cell division protein FtsB